LVQYQLVTDKQTDSQTDRHGVIAYTTVANCHEGKITVTYDETVG